MTTKAATSGALFAQMPFTISSPAPGLSLCFADLSASPADLRDLSPQQAAKVRSIAAPEERQHFIARKSFQRRFLAQLLDWRKPLGELPLAEAADKAPVTPLCATLSLSFSTSGDLAAACAYQKGYCGIDLERIRPIPAALDLARRFFRPEEIQEIEALPPEARDLFFVKLWVCKEACLKAYGTGVVGGLELFGVLFKNDIPRLAAHPPGTWSLLATVPFPEAFSAVALNSIT